MTHEPDSIAASAAEPGEAPDEDQSALGEAQVQGHPALENGNTPESDLVNLDLVMDVELNVTLRFGQRQLALREVMDLSCGSVVELNRQVEEPIELLLDGRVIARGEAVVIDGNYGLRVLEVLQPVSSSTPAMLKDSAA